MARTGPRGVGCGRASKSERLGGLDARLRTITKSTLHKGSKHEILVSCSFFASSSSLALSLYPRSSLLLLLGLLLLPLLSRYVVVVDVCFALTRNLLYKDVDFNNLRPTSSSWIIRCAVPLSKQKGHETSFC